MALYSCKAHYRNRFDGPQGRTAVRVVKVHASDPLTAREQATPLAKAFLRPLDRRRGWLLVSVDAARYVASGANGVSSAGVEGESLPGSGNPTSNIHAKGVGRIGMSRIGKDSNR